MSRPYHGFRYFIALTFCLSLTLDAICQSDSTLIKGELTWTRSVPFSYNRSANEMDSGFIDTEYSSIVKKGSKIIPSLINFLADTAKTQIIDNCTGDYFSIGQLSYILIDNIKPIPFASITGETADVMLTCSNLANGVLEYVRYHGTEFQSKYRTYFYSVKYIGKKTVRIIAHEGS